MFPSARRLALLGLLVAKAAAAASPQPSDSAHAGDTLRGADEAYAKEQARRQADSRSTHSPRIGVRFVVLLPSLDIGFQLLSQPSPGLGGGLGLEPGAWRLAVTGIWRPAIHLPVADVSDVSAKVDRVTTSFIGCRWFAPSRLELAPCITASLQWLQAVAAGPGITPQPSTATWLALGPTGLGRLRLGRSLAVTAKAGFEIQTARPILFIDALGVVEQAGPLEVSATLGAEWIF